MSSIPWSEKGFKTTPISADEVMILDSEDSDPETINKRITLSSIPSAGQTNTASNLGGGEGVFAQKSGVDLQFKSLFGETDKIILTSDSNTITFTLGTDVVLINNANTYTAGFTQSFVADATNAGININNQVPSAPVAGDIFRSTNTLQYSDNTSTTRDLVDLSLAQTLTNKTLTEPVIATIFNGGDILTLPSGPQTLVGKTTTDTLTNKTLTEPIISTIFNDDILTLPSGPETLVALSTTDVLQNKTLITPVISQIINSGTLTLPSSTDVLVGRNTIDVFTNKIFDANATGNSLSNVDVADLADATTGELITWNVSGVPTTVSVGVSGQVLTSQGSGSAPIFASISTGTLNIVRLEGIDISTNREALNFIDTTNQIDFLVIDDVSNNEADITATISSSYVGQSSIITLGTITTGVWNGTTITVPFGGTGNATLNENGVLFGNGVGAIGATLVGTVGQLLTSNGVGLAPTFQDISSEILPVPDTTSVVEGSVDDTKELRFEIDGFTSGATRIITPPDANIILVNTSDGFIDTANISDGTAGELFTWDSSGLSDKVATGIIGQVLTSNGIGNPPEFQTAVSGDSESTWAASDEDSPLNVGVQYVTEVASTTLTLSDIKISLKNAPTGSIVQVDIEQETAPNANDFTGNSIFSVLPQIEINEFFNTNTIVTPEFSDTTWEINTRLRILISLNDSNFAATGLKVNLL